MSVVFNPFTGTFDFVGTSGGGSGATPNENQRVIGFVVGDGVNVISAGITRYIWVPYAGTITAATVLSIDSAVTSGSIVVDVWKVAYGSYPPTVANTITASAKPTLSSEVSSQDTTLTGWTTSINAGDTFGFHVDSASSVKAVAVELRVTAAA